MRFRFMLVATLTCLLAGPCRADQPKAKVHRAPAPVAAAPQPAAPAVALRPDQMPATPPQVAFQHGLLTISAENSTLGDILRAVRNQTGASVEVPANATERVVGNFGPGPARDVLSSLLNGSHFNYVLLGSATNPEALERVVLIVKSAGDLPPITTEAASATPAPASGGPDMGADDQADQTTDDNIFGEDTGAQAEEQAPTPAQPTRTPEQMLQDLQRQQEVQQQIQQRQQQLGISPGLPGPRGMPLPGGAQPQPQ